MVTQTLAGKFIVWRTRDDVVRLSLRIAALTARGGGASSPAAASAAASTELWPAFPSGLPDPKAPSVRGVVLGPQPLGGLSC